MSSVDEKISSFFESKKILISGSSGYIGSNLLSRLSEIKCEIACLTSNPNLKEVLVKEYKNRKANISISCGAYRDRSLWEKNIKDVDVIFHLASQTSFYKAESDPAQDYMDNVFPMQLLLDLVSKEKKKPFIVFAGTSTQCGIKDSLPVGEDQKDNPSTIYDLHKLMAENYLKYYCIKEEAEGCCLRLCNVYGPGSKSSKDDRGILNLIIKKG